MCKFKGGGGWGGGCWFLFGCYSTVHCSMHWTRTKYFYNLAIFTYKMSKTIIWTIYLEKLCQYSIFKSHGKHLGSAEVSPVKRVRGNLESFKVLIKYKDLYQSLCWFFFSRITERKTNCIFNYPVRNTHWRVYWELEWLYTIHS